VNEYAEENLDFILKVQKYFEASPKKRAPAGRTCPAWTWCCRR
jgi:hypothetical protein